MSDYEITRRKHAKGSSVTTTSICLTERHKQMAAEANLSLSACTRLGIERAFKDYVRNKNKYEDQALQAA